MRYDELFKVITRLCAEMMAAGGSGEMISYRMKCLCKRYGINEAEFMISPGAVLATADAPDGMALTAIVPLKSLGQDFGKLQKFDEYCSVIADDLPSSDEIEKELDKINTWPGLSRGLEYVASVMLGTGFAALFGCSLTDAFVAAAACLLIAFISGKLRKFSSNLFFNNTVVCLAVISMILAAARYLGICSHPESVALGVIMLLISGLSFSEGLWSMINKDITIGIYKLNNAVIGAVGIVIGTATPLLLIGNGTIKGLSISAPFILQTVECMIACAGFALLCCTSKRHVPAVAAGAGLSWLVYLLFSKLTPSLFLSMAAATAAVTFYAVFCSSKLKINPNITRMVGILPLVPGTNLFYMLYGVVSGDYDKVLIEGTKMITVCLGISFGFTLGRLLLERKIKEMI